MSDDQMTQPLLTEDVLFSQHGALPTTSVSSNTAGAFPSSVGSSQQELEESLSLPFMNLAVGECKHNLPQANAMFEPRESLMDAIDRAFRYNRHVVIAGSGGMGKSQLAKHFAHARIATGAYTLVWRMEARCESEIEIGYKGLAEALGLEIGSSPLQEVIAAVHSTLHENTQRRRWLIIYDDPKTDEQFFGVLTRGLPIAPQHGLGHVLLTSRSPHWSTVQIVPIAPFTETEAFRFVSKLLPHAAAAQCTALCDTLGYHPLALSQALGYLQRTKRDIGAYIAAWRNSHTLRGSAAASLLDGYGQTIESTVRLAVEQLTLEGTPASELALRLVDAVSFMAAVPVPDVILNRFCTQIAFRGSFAEALRKCEEYGLLQIVTDDALKAHQMHELTSEVRRSQIPIRQHADIRMSWVSLFQHVFDLGQVPSRQLLVTQEQMVVHAEKVLKEWADGRRLPTSETSADDQHLWSQISSTYYSLGCCCATLTKFSLALSCFDAALSIDTALGNERLSSLAHCCGAKANLLVALTDYTQALSLNARALEIFKELYGDSHATIACTIRETGEIYRLLGDFSKSIMLYEQALEMFRNVYLEDHVDIADTLNNMAGLLFTLGDYTKTLKLYEEALRMYTKLLGWEHPNVFVTMGNIGGVHETLGDYQKALESHERSYQARKAIFGPRHPNTASTMRNLGNVYDSMGNYKKALEMYEQALQVFRECYGDNHPDTAATGNRMVFILLAYGDYARALKAGETSRRVYNSLYGPNHPYVADTNTYMTLIHYSRGQYAKALQSAAESERIYTIMYGEEHPDLATAFNNTGLIYFAVGDCERAIELYTRALVIYRIKYGDVHPFMALTQSNVALARAALGQNEAALALFHESTNMNCTALTETRYAQFLLLQGAYESAFQRSLHAITGKDAQLLHWNKYQLSVVAPALREAIEAVLRLNLNADGAVNISPKVLAFSIFVECAIILGRTNQCLPFVASIQEVIEQQPIGGSWYLFACVQEKLFSKEAAAPLYAKAEELLRRENEDLDCA